MLPAQVTTSPMTTALVPEKVAKDVQVNSSNQPEGLTQLQECILGSQHFILDTVNLAEVMSDVFDKNVPEAALHIPDDLHALSGPEKYACLAEIIRQLDIYFLASLTNRDEQGSIVERWDATAQKAAIENLSDADKEQLRSALEPFKPTDNQSLEFTDQTTLIFPGAAVPRMQLRAEFAIAQNSINKSPGLLICNGSSRPLVEIDHLKDSDKDKNLHINIERLVEKLDDYLGPTATETHAQMALMDMLRTDDRDCFLSKQPIYVVYTGGVRYHPQSLLENGEYSLNYDQEKSGRPNTEATMVSAFKALEQLPGTTPEDIVLVSNQPHIYSQQIATKRVVANRWENHGHAPISIRACGEKASLESTNDLFLAIDSVRKSIQLLNPDYHVTTNWVDEPQWKLFESNSPGEWQLYKPKQPPVELLIQA